jgi:O-methyltransferase
MKYKGFFKKLINFFGYEIYKKTSNEVYTLSPGFNYYTYSPWFEIWFQEIYNKIINNTVVKEDRCYIIYNFVKHCLHLEGDFAECGVYRGGTAYLIANTIKNSSNKDKLIHLFDSFTGMPNTAVMERDSHKEGDFGDNSIDNVKNYLSEFNNISYYPGFIPYTFSLIAGDKIFSLVHIDVDIYKSTQDCCKFFYDKMVKGGIMIFDDYGFPKYKYAEKLAVDEFFVDKPENPISLQTGQCIVIKL